MTSVLAAVDDSAATRPVLQMALALATVLGAEVEAVHVAQTPGHTAQNAAQALGVPLRTVAGDPTAVILDLASHDDVVAVVVGARDRPTGRLPAGHVALSLAGALVRPVVVVPPGARPPEQLARVLIAMEGTRRKARSLQQAVQVAAGSDIDLVVVHVEGADTIPAFSDQVQYESEAYAAEFLARCLPGAPEAHVQLRIGLPADEVLAAADELSPDLLAIGWPRSDDPSRGLVAREIVHRSHVPVLLVALANDVESS